MPEQKLFAYGTLLSEHKFGKSRNNSPYGELISIEPAYALGKMYASEWFPIVLRPNDVKRVKSPNYVFGGLITFETDDKVWRSLDGYEGCSKSAFGENRTSDLYHRELVDVTVIKFKTMEDFMFQKFEIIREDKAQMYFGNPESPNIKARIGQQKRAGNIWKTFFSVKFGNYQS